ncbi:penicillin acylase family protein [Microbacterium gilvum]|uniref:Penicillin amidase n=1 Tax=Microbacterium gilvum TaxID=1336204 RepID=A0ABP9ASX9_9MICO
MAQVFRDALGVPHIRAHDVHDLADAQGEVTARDRGWQIEVDRLRAAGRLSELIGRAGVAWDVFARRARLDDTARRAFSALDDETRTFIAAYARGVRRGMSAAGAHAEEFAALDRAFGTDRLLEPWHDHDPLGVLHVAHALFSPFPSLLWREHVAATLGDAWVDVLSGDEGDETEPTSGSNAWALAGTRTASGRPVVAGDPHRLFELPGVYQQVRLACDHDGIDVVGLAFPGVPGAPHFAHTGGAAWGITNAVAHSVEVFREQLRRAGDGYEALGPDGWSPADVRRSTVHVRGGDDVAVTAIETPRGCIVTDLRPDGDALVGWSVRHPARTRSDLGARALLPLLRARTASDVVSAFESWVDPVNRVLAADRDGAVLSATAGLVPDRPRSERRRALDGASNAPARDRRPPAATRVAEVAVDANERPAEPAVDLGWAYASPHRARRISRLLAELRPDGVEGFAAIWGDVDSGQRHALLPLLPDGPLSGSAARAREALRSWDGRMDAGSRAAGVFAAWRGALVRALVDHPALAALSAPHGFGAVFDPWMAVAGRVAGALPRLLRHPAIADRALVVDALAAAADAPPWGDVHTMLPLHVLDDVAELAGGASRGAAFATPLSGDGDTVRCTGSTPGAVDRAWRGSVARWAWDLDDRSRSLWSVPFGTSGDASSPHAGDQHAAWVHVRPTRITTDWRFLRPDLSTGDA